LAAATGNPVGILDDNISTSLPNEAAGFSPVAALNANIQLAKITGKIVQSTTHIALG
jgi:proline utilization trans-activator